ncbi:hypothetical protein [Sphingobium sp. YR768]|uniref:hypothetical protein n=1 Tax=Sphingobium sp. YR768 TaxID=1884365 RepID=UPI0008B296AB|nr:hypothetical protein [Sphingobium sp. YR768]SES11942.1 hypothetical protein SAMN05518866_1418 [Sphingobium sp. YR768]
MCDYDPIIIKAISDAGVEVGDRSASWLEKWANISTIVAVRAADDEPGRVTVGIGFRQDRVFIEIDEEGQWTQFCAVAHDHFPLVAPFAELREALAEPGMLFLHWEEGRLRQ